jgi:lipopolysaccharide transport system permease protein
MTSRPIVMEFGQNQPYQLAISDVIEGIRLWRLAVALGSLDIRLRYRGSVLGPFWLTLSTAVMVISLGILYSTLFKTDIHEYLPFLALSQVLWFFLSAIIAEACTCFTQMETAHAVRMPFFVYALRTVIRNVFVFAHNIVVIIGVFVYFAIWPGTMALWALPGLVLWIIDALAICLLLGGFCARFRDIGPIVGSIMQIAFFMSPIIWKPEMLGEGTWALPFNPFYSMIEIVRAPLLGSLPSMVWPAAIGYSLVLLAVTWKFFVRVRGRIAFWV